MAIISAATYDHDSEVVVGLEIAEVNREGLVRVGCLSWSGPKGGESSEGAPMRRRSPFVV